MSYPRPSSGSPVSSRAGVLAVLPLFLLLLPSPAHHGQAQGAADERIELVLEGLVLGPDGTPAVGAVVVSSSGGQAVTDASGSYRLETSSSSGATAVRVTAVGSSGANLAASAYVSLAARSSHVEPLRLAPGASCTPSWLPTFGARPGTDLDVHALAVYDDGSGSALYLGGAFAVAGNVDANRVARWDGVSWAALGGGMDQPVHALAVFDDGSGQALYAGGSFTTAGGVAASGVARWDGAAWSSLGSGVSGTERAAVYALAVFDDGSGPALYAGGRFTIAGGVTASGIARWDGGRWSAVGGGVSGFAGGASVRALAAHDDGSGPALYVGGIFTIASGTLASHVARWNGTRWSELRSGVDGTVECLVSHAGSLFAGGRFSTADGVPASRVARWDGSGWSRLGAGASQDVEALVVHDDGSGPALYMSSHAKLSRWDGAAWTRLGVSVAPIRAFAVYDEGDGPALFAGGSFTSTGGVPAGRVARWDGSSWSTLGSGLNGRVHALAAHDDGSGPALFAGGEFTGAGGVLTGGVAKWDGVSWSAVGTGLSGGAVLALAVYDEGDGPELYAGGAFVRAGGVGAQGIARWDGARWEGVGGGIQGTVHALCVFDEGLVRALYAGGSFGSAGGMTALRVARWDGWSWSPAGSGTSARVDALAVHDDGTGAALFAGGPFTSAGGLPARHVARWDGWSWAPVGGGTARPVKALAVFDDGLGPALFAGTRRRIERWDGAAWADAGGVLTGDVHALAAHDDGGGAALFVGGTFVTAGGVAANGVVRWDGAAFSPCGGGVRGGIDALAIHDDGAGAALFAGGSFWSAFDSRDSHLARWGCPSDTTPPVLECDPVAAVEPFGSGGAVVHFSVRATDDRDPDPAVVCTPPSGSFFPRGTTVVDCTATDAAGNRTTCSFSVSVVRKTRER